MEKSDKKQIMSSIILEKDKFRKIYQFYLECLKNQKDTSFQLENKEDKLLISNGLVDKSIILSQKFSLYKLKFLFERIVFRNYFIGVGRNSKVHEIANSFLKKDLLVETESIILIIQLTDNLDCVDESLYKCRIEISEGIKFFCEESDLICRGAHKIKEKIGIFEKDILLQELLEEDENIMGNNEHLNFGQDKQNEEVFINTENCNFQNFKGQYPVSDNFDCKEILKYLEKVCYIIKLNKFDFYSLTQESKIVQNEDLTDEYFLNTEFICLPNLDIKNNNSRREIFNSYIKSNVLSENDLTIEELKYHINFDNNYNPSTKSLNSENDIQKNRKYSSLEILDFLISKDELEINSYLSKYHDQLKNKIREISLKSNQNSLECNLIQIPENIISSTLENSLEIEDIYFLKYVKDRKYKYNTLFTCLNLEGYSESKLKNSLCGFDFIFSNTKKNSEDNYENENEISSIIKKLNNLTSYSSIIRSYLLINNSESIFNNQEFLTKLSKENLEIKTQLFKEGKKINLCDLINDKKLSFSEKETLYRNLLTKITSKNFSLGIEGTRKGNDQYNFIQNGKQIKSNNLSSNFDILFISSSTGLLGILNKYENDPKILDIYYESLYKQIENNIYKSFSEFKKEKLNFLTKKSLKPAEEIISLSNEIFSHIILSIFKSELNHYYSSHRRYSTIIDDLLNIQDSTISNTNESFKNNKNLTTNIPSSISISSSIEVEASIILYKRIIQEEYDKFNLELISFYSKFAIEFEQFYIEKRNEINIWTKKIVIHTSFKLNCLTEKYKNLFYEMKNRLDIYYNEITEKDMLLILLIKDKLKQHGYMNEYMSRYLNNIQYIMKNNLNFEDDIKFGINGFLISSGIGFVSGLVTFGIGRVITILSADAISGTALGPLGTLAGATIGAASIIGSSVYHMYKSKSKLKDKFNEYESKAEELKELIYDRMEEFRIFNKNEIESRINKIMSYVELSIRKSSKIEPG